MIITSNLHFEKSVRNGSIKMTMGGSIRVTIDNTENTKIVDTLKGEAFGFLGFDFRRVSNRQNKPYILMIPKKKSRKAIKAKIRDAIKQGGSAPASVIISRINCMLTG